MVWRPPAVPCALKTMTDARHARIGSSEQQRRATSLAQDNTGTHSLCVFSHCNAVVGDCPPRRHCVKFRTVCENAFDVESIESIAFLVPASISSPIARHVRGTTSCAVCAV